MVRAQPGRDPIRADRGHTFLGARRASRVGAWGRAGTGHAFRSYLAALGSVPLVEVSARGVLATENAKSARKVGASGDAWRGYGEDRAGATGSLSARVPSCRHQKRTETFGRVRGAVGRPATVGRSGVRCARLGSCRDRPRAPLVPRYTWVSPLGCVRVGAGPPDRAPSKGDRTRAASPLRRGERWKRDRSAWRGARLVRSGIGAVRFGHRERKERKEGWGVRRRLGVIPGTDHAFRSYLATLGSVPWVVLAWGRAGTDHALRSCLAALGSVPSVVVRIRRNSTFSNGVVLS